MYVDVRRGLVFFDRSDRVLKAQSLTRYDPVTGQLHPLQGARPDDMVCDVSRDGTCLSLRSVDWLIVRGTNRSRVGFLSEDAPPCTTDRVLSHWSVFDPSGRRALTGILNGKERPVVMDTMNCEIVATMARKIDARYGAVDPVHGRLWVPDARSKNSLLSVDCATGELDQIAMPAVAWAQRVRFTQDGASLLVLSQLGVLSRHERDGSMIWSMDMSKIGKIGAGSMFLNEVASHLLISLPDSKNSRWGEDVVLNLDNGRVEVSIRRHQGPPARLASDWFGDRVLTYAGEIVDFFSGEVVGELALGETKDVVPPSFQEPRP